MIRKTIVVACALAALPTAAAAAAPDSWRAGPSMSTWRQYPTVVALHDGRLMFVGAQSSKAVDLYDPASETFSNTVAALNTTRNEPLATTLSDGRVLVAGADLGTDSTAEVYDPAANTWTPTGDNMHARRGSPNAGDASGIAPLPDGRALLAGGEDGAFHPTAAADIFDPTLHSGSGGFTAAPPMSTARVGDAAAALPGGDVLVVGGTIDGQSTLSSGEVYHSATNSWTPVANGMATGHYAPTAVALPGGKVLVFGGVELSATASPKITIDSEIYDPSTNRFSPTGPLLTAAIQPAAGSLPDGRVVAAGGFLATGLPIAGTATQVYEPSIDGWVTGADALAPTASAGAALPDGEFMVADSLVASAPGTPTHIYTPADAPGAPSGVAALAGDGAALVTWAPAADNGRPVTRYTVRASNGATLTTGDAATHAVLAVPNGAPVTFTVTATNDVGTGPASAASAAVTPGGPAKPDTTAPTVKVSKLKSKLKLKSFLKGVTASITTSEPAALSVDLLAAARKATIAKAYNVVLGSKSYGLATARKVKVKPSKKLVGHARKFTVRVRITAVDAAGNQRTINKTIKVSR